MRPTGHRPDPLRYRPGRARIATLCALGLGLMSGPSFPAAQTPQRPPVFRAGVDLVTVDLVVLDRSGQPVTDLGIDDFTVVADRRPRRIVSAEYVASPRARARGADVGTVPGTPASPGVSSNAPTPGGRTFLFVVDADGIRAGEGRQAMAGLADYVARLDPADRAGLVVLPYGSPRVDLTTDRSLIRRAAEGVVGASQAVRDRMMTYGEAESIRRGDTRALLAYFERATGALASSTSTAFQACEVPRTIPIEEPQRVAPACAQIADQALDQHRRRTRAILDSLRALADAMASVAGQKTLVLVSEGFLNDEETVDAVARFAAAAERARVSLYSLHLQAPLMDASGASSSATGGSRQLDDRAGFDSLAEVAASARGTAFRVIGSPDPIFARLDAELAGYYLLTFERDPADRARARVGIDVRVGRDGLDVRARREFASDAAAGAAPARARPAANDRLAMGELLKWPIPVSDVGLDVTTFTTPAPEDDHGALVLVAAEISADTPVAAVGYEIVDETGKAVADAFDAPASLRPLAGGRSQYLVAVPLGPGSYRLRLGVIGRTGDRGSLDHAFDVVPWSRAMRAGDVIFGDDADGVFRPIVRLRPEQARLVARVELRAEGLLAFDGATATVAVSRIGDGSPRETVAVQLAEVGDPGRRVVGARFDARAFDRGEHLVTVVITTPGGEVIARSRRISR